MKKRRFLSILLTLTMVIGLVFTGYVSVSAARHIDTLYLKPHSSVMEIMTSHPGSVIQVTSHCEDGVYITEMTRVGSALYKAVISRSVELFEFTLSDRNGIPYWQAPVINDAPEELNCVSFEADPDIFEWTQYGSSAGGSEPEVPGNSILYFTPNAEWLSIGTRFSVCINNGSSQTYEELTLVDDNVYMFIPNENDRSYTFCILRDGAIQPSQVQIRARTVSKPAGNLNHYILTGGSTSGASGRWILRETDNDEEPEEILPPVEGPDADDEVSWGYSADEIRGYTTLAEALLKTGNGHVYITMIKSIYSENTIMVSGGNFTLDLAGSSVISNADIPFVLENTTLTIKNSHGDGTIESILSENFMFNPENSKLYIEGGTFRTGGAGIIRINDSTTTATISGGNFHAGSASAITVSGGKLNLDGGSFSGNCGFAHITFEGTEYNNNIYFSNLDTNGSTTLMVITPQTSIQTIKFGAAGRVIASTEQGGEKVSSIATYTFYYIDINLKISFSSGSSAGSVRKGNAYILPEYSGSYPSGQLFAGWKDSETQEIYSAGASVFPTKDMQFTPVWEQGENISVAFNANGGSGSMSPMTGTANAPFVLPNCNFTPPEGKIFDKWQINGSSFSPGESVVLAANSVATALWQDGIRVTYKANGGGGDDIVTYVASGTKFVLSKNTFTPPEGTSFRAWQVNGRELAPNNAITITQDTDILAIWESGYIVTYKPNGGSGQTVKEVYSEVTEIILPENTFTPPEGKFFRCWRVNGEELMPGDSYTVREATDIIPLWANGYTIKYVLNIRTENGEYTYTRNDNLAQGSDYIVRHPMDVFPNQFNESRFFAVDWTADSGITYDFDEPIRVTKDITLTLNYKLKYTVTIMHNNDSATQEAYEYYEGDNFTLPEPPEANPVGYVFGYWESYKTEEKFNPGDQITLTQSEGFSAIWEKCDNHSFADDFCEHCDCPETAVLYDYSTQTKTVTAVVAKSGTYMVIFADYNGQILSNVALSELNITEEKAGTMVELKLTKGFNLAKGDKILLVESIGNLKPLCDAYILD